MPQRQTITLHSLQFLFEYCLFEHLKYHRIIHKEWARETVSHQYFKLDYQIKRNSWVLLQLNICRFDTIVWQFRGSSLCILIVFNILYDLPVDAIVIFINFFLLGCTNQFSLFSFSREKFTLICYLWGDDIVWRSSNDDWLIEDTICSLHFFSLCYFLRWIKTQYKMNFPIIHNKKNVDFFFQIIGRMGEIIFFLKHSDNIAVSIRLQITEINNFQSFLPEISYMCLSTKTNFTVNFTLPQMFSSLL